MFYGCSSFRQDISRWDVNKVTESLGMFATEFSDHYLEGADSLEAAKRPMAPTFHTL